MPFGMRAVEATKETREEAILRIKSPMPFGMRAVEAQSSPFSNSPPLDPVTNAFRHEGR